MLFLLGATALAAQASLAAHVVVLEPVVTGAGVRPVEFGTVTPGTPVAVTITAEADTVAGGRGRFPVHRTDREPVRAARPELGREPRARDGDDDHPGLYTTTISVTLMRL